MYHHLFSVVWLSASLIPKVFAASNHHPHINIKAFKAADIITRDVAIIGGGSAGTYSALSLKDKGKSIVVIEKKDRIGGHTETYIDPATGTPIDMGVVIWHNLTIARDYFKRLNVPIITLGSDADPNAPAQLSANYDIRTGKQVNISSPTPEETAAAFAAYAEQLQKYPRLNDGMYLPDPVPEDLSKQSGFKIHNLYSKC